MRDADFQDKQRTPNGIKYTTKMDKLVTIAIPIYKRLEHLSHVLGIVEAQDYAEIELLVSDNGMNGDRVHDLVRKHYSRPFVFRQNPRTVPMGNHFTQLVEAANGEYFVPLCDDDEISPNYVTEMVNSLERHPEAAVAISRQEMTDLDRSVLRSSKEEMPPVLSFEDFIDSMWRRYQFGLEGLVTMMARTARLRECGGYPDFCWGTNMDNAALLRMIVGSSVALNTRCVFRWRQDDASYGWSVTTAELARGMKEFINFLSTDPVIGRYRAAEPVRWRKCEEILLRMTWETYLLRWDTIYRKRLGTFDWLMAAFRMPLFPAYYKRVAKILIRDFKAKMAPREFPQDPQGVAE